MAIVNILTKLSLATTGAAVVALAVAGTAQAGTLNNSTGLNNPTQTINFNEFPLAEGEQVTNQFSSLGVTFTNLYNFSAPNNPNSNIAGNTLINYDFNASTINNPFSIKFNNTLTEAAFTLVTNPGTSTLTALLNSVVVETFTATTDTSGNFYGFTGINFDEIVVNAGGFNNGAIIDNIQTSKSVPEPASLMGILGLGAFGITSLRKRRQQVAVKA